MQAFENWMRTKLHFTHYRDGWFWNEYRRDCGEWPTAAERKRGREMREEYLNDQRTA